MALEVRRRVKEQQKRIGAAEFRNTHFSYTLGADGVEKFVSTPELQSEGGIGDEPLEAGQIWTLSPGGQDEHPGLFRLEVSEGPGSGVRVLNKPVPAAVPGIDPLRRAEPLCPGHAAGRRPRPARP
jgi:ATP-dependent Lon protease